MGDPNVQFSIKYRFPGGSFQLKFPPDQYPDRPYHNDRQCGNCHGGYQDYPRENHPGRYQDYPRENHSQGRNKSLQDGTPAFDNLGRGY